MLIRTVLLLNLRPSSTFEAREYQPLEQKQKKIFTGFELRTFSI